MQVPDKYFLWNRNGGLMRVLRSQLRLLVFTVSLLYWSQNQYGSVQEPGSSSAGLEVQFAVAD